MMRAGGTLTALNTMKHSIGTMHGMQTILPIAGWTWDTKRAGGNLTRLDTMSHATGRMFGMASEAGWHVLGHA